MWAYKVRCAALVTALLGALGCTAVITETRHERVYRPAAHPVAMDVSIFYSDLEPYGRWFVYGSYGWVWTPYDVPYGWRPYTYGRWVYSDYGWTWVSTETWGWAPYHYGRWLFDADYGWIWVPDTVWAPAWVCWRWSDDWIGWAPLPPGVHWQVGVGLQFGGRDLHRDLDVPAWCFVRRHWFLEPNVRFKLEPSPRNVSLMPATKVFADYDEFDRRPRNKGITIGEIERSLPRPVPRVKVADADSPRQSGRLRGGKEIQVYRPEILSPTEKPPSMTPKVETREIPDPAIRTRKEKEQRRLESFFERQLGRVESEQRKELRRATAGADTLALRKRHEEERRALEAQKQRELKVTGQRLEKGIIKPGRKTKPVESGAPK